MTSAVTSVPSPSAVGAPRLWSPEEGFLTVLLIAAACDGPKARRRISLVDNYVHVSPLLEPLGEAGRVALRRAVIPAPAEREQPAGDDDGERHRRLREADAEHA